MKVFHHPCHEHCHLLNLINNVELLDLFLHLRPHDQIPSALLKDIKVRRRAKEIGVILGVIRGIGDHF